jgi:hypothetical protein
MQMVQAEDAKKTDAGEKPNSVEESDTDSTTSTSSSDSDGGAPIEAGASELFTIDTKKRRRDSDAPVAKDASTTDKKPKSKKTKTAVVEESSDSDETSESESEDEELEKKEKKEKKEIAEKVKAKKDKKVTKKKDSDDAKVAPGNPVEQWNVGGLGGGEQRQSKFMRLLGGKKSGASLTAPTNTKSDSITAEADIQRQFEQGMKSKNEGGSHRRGLGA